MTRFSYALSISTPWYTFLLRATRPVTRRCSLRMSVPDVGREAKRSEGKEDGGKRMCREMLWEGEKINWRRRRDREYKKELKRGSNIGGNLSSQIRTLIRKELIRPNNARKPSYGKVQYMNKKKPDNIIY